METGLDGKLCRACVSVEELMKRAKEFARRSKGTEQDNEKAESPRILHTHSQDDCPVDKEELGRSTWKLLHTMSVYYPEKPTDEHKNTASTFMDCLSKTYPCDYCAKDLRRILKEDPPKLGNRNEFATWMCQLHNKVNKKLGKPEFDCSQVFERWKDGWKTGECDY